MVNVLTHIAPDSRSADVADWIRELGLGVYDHPQAILVSGGDGTLLEAIHKYQELQLPFFGINRGTCGFLLNPIASREELVGALGEFPSWRIIELKLLRVVLLLADGTMRETFAFNDAFFKANRGEIAGVVSGERFPEQKFCGDGIIISTPQGSTAYNKSAGGSILPLEKNLIAVTSICSAIEPMRLVVSDQVIQVTITRNQAQSVFRADRFDTNGCVSAYIYPDGPKVRLAFLSHYDFEFRRYQPRFS